MEATPEFVDRVGDFRVQVEGRALTITGDFPEANIWRFDLTTFDGAFDMREALRAVGQMRVSGPQFARGRHDMRNCWATPKRASRTPGPGRSSTASGWSPRPAWPWTASTSTRRGSICPVWPIRRRAGSTRVSPWKSPKPGRHTVRISFDDFVYGTRWRPRRPGDTKPPVTHGRNDLRPHHIASIAIGVDERVRDLEEDRA